jgi:hypothetical protein
VECGTISRLIKNLRLNVSSGKVLVRTLPFNSVSASLPALPKQKDKLLDPRTTSTAFLYQVVQTHMDCLEALGPISDPGGHIIGDSSPIPSSPLDGSENDRETFFPHLNLMIHKFSSAVLSLFTFPFFTSMRNCKVLNQLKAPKLDEQLSTIAAAVALSRFKGD